MHNVYTFSKSVLVNKVISPANLSSLVKLKLSTIHLTFLFSKRIEDLNINLKDII